MSPTPTRRVIAWDTETDLIRPGMLAPPLVCLTWQELGQTAKIAHVSEAEPILKSWLEDPNAVLVGHNVAYDLGVVCQEFPALTKLVFSAYDECRITDTMIRQQLFDISSGSYKTLNTGNGIYKRITYDLASVAKRTAGVILSKDAWRVSYSLFRDAPLSQWVTVAKDAQRKAEQEVQQLKQLYLAAREAGIRADHRSLKDLSDRIESLNGMIGSDPSRAVSYPLDDARATLAIYYAQEKHREWLSNQYEQAYAAWWLHLSSAWGLKTDKQAADILEREATEELTHLTDTLLEGGILREDGTRDVKRMREHVVKVCNELKRAVRMTDAHAASGKCKDRLGNKLDNSSPECVEHVALDGDTLEQVAEESQDPFIKAYYQLSVVKKILGTDVQALQKGTEFPIQTRYGLAETGRTTSSGPNIQNWVRARACARCEGRGEI